MSTPERLQHILVTEYRLPPERIFSDARLDELGIDSLGQMELLFKIEDEFDIKMPNERVDLATLGDVARYVDALAASQHATRVAGART